MEVRKAYDFTMDHVGQDIHSGEKFMAGSLAGREFGCENKHSACDADTPTNTHVPTNTHHHPTLSPPGPLWQDYISFLSGAKPGTQAYSALWTSGMVGGQEEATRLAELRWGRARLGWGGCVCGPGGGCRAVHSGCKQAKTSSPKQIPPISNPSPPSTPPGPPPPQESVPPRHRRPDPLAGAAVEAVRDVRDGAGGNFTPPSSLFFQK